QQNTDPFVEFRNATTRNPELYCQNSASPQCTIPATCTLGSPCPLSNLPQTYTVTLGPSSTLNPAIDQQIANATLGFYLNNEANPSLLQPFFLQLLQNFVRFNSYETVRLISAKTSQATRYSTSLPVSGTSHDVVFSLMWSKQLGALRLTVTPPGGARPIVRARPSVFISLVQPLPVAPPFDPRGDWKIEIDIEQSAPGTLVAGGATEVPFNLHIMTDDAGTKTELGVVPGDYKSGDPIKLRAK